MRDISFLVITAFSTIITWLSTTQQLFAQDMLKDLKVVNRSLSAGDGAGSIRLNEVEGVGIAWINGKTFSQGTIEFDIKGNDQMQRSFVGMVFHGVDNDTYEAIYFRPFNFRSPDPARKAHSVQYIAMPDYDWPKLRNDFPNRYEQPVDPAPDPNQWFHAKIVVSGKKISVYVNGADKSALTVESLLSLNGQMIGYWVGNNSGGDWKNLKITP